MSNPAATPPAVPTAASPSASAAAAPAPSPLASQLPWQLVAQGYDEERSMVMEPMSLAALDRLAARSPAALAPG
ncbi:MAG TPA: hypothetical protein VLC09_07870, partial [Polyangiaceae bacterium]|nr:hypothetical protein [Polyangiaceae bacterium]